MLVDTYCHRSVKIGHVEEFRCDNSATRMTTRVSVFFLLIEQGRVLWVARYSKSEMLHAGVDEVDPKIILAILERN